MKVASLSTRNFSQRVKQERGFRMSFNLSIDEGVEHFVRSIEERVVRRVAGILHEVFSGGLPLEAKKSKPVIGGGARATVPGAAPAKKLRKKPPRQFCPVPGCKNVAAPIFGMVCSEHKTVAKSKINKYRKARKASKESGTTSKKSKALVFKHTKAGWKGVKGAKYLKKALAKKSKKDASVE
jgi:hypothetical protein